MGRVDFDAFSLSYDRLRGTSRERLMPWVSEAAAYMRLRKKERLMDLGCGTGRYTRLFTEVCDDVTGVDRSGGMLSVASARSGPVHYVMGEAASLPFRNGCFDAVTMFMAVHHFGVSGRKSMLGEVNRVLDKDGRILILTESHARISRSVWRLFPGFLEIERSRFPDIVTLSNELKEAGFSTGHKSVTVSFGEVRTVDYLEKVRNKFISTFSLMSEEQFSRGLSIFSSKLIEEYPLAMPDIQEYVLVLGRKP